MELYSGLSAGWASRASPSGGFHWVSVWCRLRRPLAYAQTSTVSSIVVQGISGSRLTPSALFPPGPNGRLDAFQIDEGVKALFRPACSRMSPRIQGGRLTITSSKIRSSIASLSKATRRSRTSSSRPKSSRRSAARLSPVVQADTARLVEVYRRSGRLTFASTRSHRLPTTASISSSKSPRAQRPGSGGSSSSAIAHIRLTGSRTSSRPPRPDCSPSCRPAISMIRPGRSRSRAVASILPQARLYRRAVVSAVEEYDRLCAVS